MRLVDSKLQAPCYALSSSPATEDRCSHADEWQTISLTGDILQIAFLSMYEVDTELALLLAQAQKKRVFDTEWFG